MFEFKISSNVLIGLATVPLLGIILGSRAIAEALQTMGESSEEVFRGDRLPLLNLTNNSKEL